MSAMEMLVKSVFNMLDLDPDQVKAEVLGRVKQFEDNVKALNTSLANIFTRTDRLPHIERKLDAIMAHHSIPYPKETTNVRPANGSDDNPGKSLPAPQGPSETVQ